MERAQKLALLKSELEGRVYFGEPPGGLVSGQSEKLTSFPKGVLAQVTGFGKSEWVMEVLTKSSLRRVAWVEANLSVNPVGIFQRGLDLTKLLLVRADEELPWVVQQLVGSSLFDVVLVGLDKWSCAREVGKVRRAGYGDLSDKVLRRLQLTAERTSCGVVLLSDQVNPHFSIRYRWAVHEAT